MASPSSVADLLDKIPVSKDDIMAYGVSLFINELEPDKIDMKWFENGWQLTVKTDDEKVEKMKKFWYDNIKPRL